MAEAYPMAQVIGYDYHYPSIAIAKVEAQRRTLGNVDFQCADASSFGSSEKEFDM